MTDKIDVLDKGYVRYIGHMGSDLEVVNAARVSFQKESKELTEKDENLIHFLAENDHTSPFRHVFFSFEVKAPLVVARQWWKYVVGSTHTDGWNESSRRYVTEEPVFYQPSEWRKAAENKKQGSGDPVDVGIQAAMNGALSAHIDNSLMLYNKAMEMGVAPEQARLFLPAYGMYVTWRWSASLQSVAHFLHQRLNGEAQSEIREYAKAIRQLVKDKAPVSFEALRGEKRRKYFPI
jgi:thymidylate synthase (FAD)